MAIKVNNTTVIDDSRVLQNVTGLKTVGGQSLLGSGDVQVSSAGVIPVGGTTSLQTGMIANNLYDAADGSKWQSAGVAIAYSADRHNLTALPDSTKSYFLTSTPPVHAINTVAYPSGNYFSVKYFPTTAGSILVGFHNSSNYSGVQSFYTSTTISTDQGSTWNYTTAGPYSAYFGGQVAVNPSGIVLSPYTSGSSVNINRFSGSGWTSSMPWGFTYNGFWTGSGVMYDTVLSKFAAFLTNSSGGRFISTSTDGVTWGTAQAVPSATYIFSLDYNPVLAQYYFTNNSSYVQLSSDLVNWTSYTGASSISSGGIASLDTGRYISINASSGAVYTSTDGQNWTNSANKANYATIVSKTGGSGAFLAILYSTGTYPNSQRTYSFTKDGTNFVDMPTLPVGYNINNATSFSTAVGNYYAVTINSDISSGVDVTKILNSAVTTISDQNSRVSGIPVLLGSTYYVAGTGADASSVFSSADAGITVNSTPVLTVSGATWTKVFKVGTVLIAATDTKLYTSTDGTTWTLRTTYALTALTSFNLRPLLNNTAAVIIRGNALLVTDNLTDYYSLSVPTTSVQYSSGTLADSVYFVLWNDNINHKFSKLTDFSPTGDPLFINTSSSIVSNTVVRTK